MKRSNARRQLSSVLVMTTLGLLVGCGGDEESGDSEADATTTVVEGGQEFVPGVPEIPEEEAEAQQEAVEIGLAWVAAIKDEDYATACELHVYSTEGNVVFEDECELGSGQKDRTPNNGTSSKFGEPFYDYLREGAFTELCTVVGPDVVLRDTDTGALVALEMDQTAGGIKVDKHIETTEELIQEDGYECDGQLHPFEE